VELPGDLAAIVRRLCDDLAGAAETSTIGVASPTQLVRLQRLDGRDGAIHFAVFLERFATRNSLHKAVRRFKLSAREAEVLDGLLRGEATTDIAAALGIGATTVLEHVRNIGHKMKVSKRSAIVALVVGLR
jgi:DNA-binding NarL/FixJ family response regulator